MADTIATNRIERDIIRARRETPNTTVKFPRKPFEQVAERREQFVDTADDFLKWLQATTDENKLKEIETLGPWIRTFAKVDGWIKKNYPEDKSIANLDSVLNLYQKAWTIPEEITRYSAGLWWVLSRKVRDEASLGKKKKLAEAFLKDPDTYIEANRDLFDTANLEQSFLNSAGTMILTEGLFEPIPEESHMFTTALEFTRNNSSYPVNSVEFQSYVDIRNRVLSNKISGRLNETDRTLLLKHSNQMITTLLEFIAVRPNINLNDAIMDLRLPQVDELELRRIVRDARLKVEDFIGPYNTAYGLAFSFIRSQGLVEQFKKGDADINRNLIYNKSWELHKELGLNLPQAQVQSEVQYLLTLYAQKKTDTEINLLIQGHITRNGVNPIRNIFELAMGDYEVLRHLISNPPGQLAIVADSLAAKKLINPEASRLNKLKITMLFHGQNPAFAAAMRNPQLLIDIGNSLNPPETITTVQELISAITRLKGQYTPYMEGTKEKPGFNAKLKAFENVGDMANLNVEVYSYFGLPPFATAGEIDAAIKPFVTLRDAHAKVLDLNTGDLHPKYEELSAIFERLERARPGVLEALVTGGFFYYKHKDKAGLQKDVSKYKGQYYRDLNALVGPKDQLTRIPNPLDGQVYNVELNPANYVRHFLDLDYDPPQHGIKYYFDLIYGAAKEAGINQEDIDSLIVNKGTFLRVTTPVGGSVAATAAPDELTLLAMYVKDKDGVSEKYRKLNNAVSTAQVLRDNAGFKATYDAALIQAIEREEGISNVDIERKIVSMRKDKSPAAYVGAPEEILTNTYTLNSYSLAAQARLKRAQDLISVDRTNDLIDNRIIARGDLTPRILWSQSQMIATTFLASPVTAQYFGDVLDLLNVSSSFRGILFGNQFPAQISNMNSPLAIEIIGRAGLLNAPNALKRRYLRGIRDTATTLYTQFLAQNNGLFGVGGDITRFDPTRLYRFVYMMLGNPMDYVNGSESVPNRARTLRSLFPAGEFDTVITAGTPIAVSIRRILQDEMRLNDSTIGIYLRKLKELASPTGDIELRAAAVRDIRANKKLIEVYGKGADARTLAILSANRSLEEKLRGLETSDERYEAAYGDKLQ